jgi:predicted phosphodiesterase
VKKGEFWIGGEPITMAGIQGRVALISDVHGNLEALEAVLADIDYRNMRSRRGQSKTSPIEHIWFLGDAVGYGPRPRECLEIIRKRCEPGFVLAGNHELGTKLKVSTPQSALIGFAGSGAVEGIHWTVRQFYLDNSPIEKSKEEMEKYTQGMLSRVRMKPEEYRARIFQEASQSISLGSIPLSMGGRLKGSVDVPPSVAQELLLRHESAVRGVYSKCDAQVAGSELFDYMSKLPVKIESVPGVLLVHDNELNPGDMKYMLDEPHISLTSHAYLIDREVFSRMREKGVTRLFFGHSHLPAVHTNKEFPDIKVVNVGTVGMPRENFLTTYCIWNPEAKSNDITIVELEMKEWKRTSEKMVKAGLPDKLSVAYEKSARKDAHYID